MNEKVDRVPSFNLTYSYQWNNNWPQGLITSREDETIQRRINMDVPYTEQPIGFAERDGRDLQRTRMMASVSNWRELASEDLLDEIAVDVSQLDSDEFGAI